MAHSIWPALFAAITLSACAEVIPVPQRDAQPNDDASSLADHSNTSARDAALDNDATSHDATAHDATAHDSAASPDASTDSGARCARYGFVCSASAPCCDGMSCQQGVCAPTNYCIPAGAFCTSTAGGCCAGLSCQSNACRSSTPSCVALGAACSASNPCCGTARCTSGRCQDCAPNRTDCTTDSQCCSGYCRAGFCDTRPTAGSCLTIDTSQSISCRTVSDCCADSDRCIYTRGSERCCRAIGNTCRSTLDCCGATRCVSGRCQARSLGESCENHSDCTSGMCANDRCSATACVPEGTDCWGAGRGCCPGYMCFGGLCRIDTVSGRLCKNVGASCTHSEECCFPGNCSASGRCEDSISCGIGGERCTASSQCCSGSCSGGTCTTLVACGAAGDHCGAGLGGCCAGLSCIAGTCSTPTPPPTCSVDGASCASQICCAGLGCMSGTCRAVSACSGEGAACSATQPCCSGACQSGRCASSSSGGCRGDFSITVLPFSNAIANLGASCATPTSPRNCPRGEGIVFGDTNTCTCTVSCAQIEVIDGAMRRSARPGESCTADGSYVCATIRSTSTGDGGEFCVARSANICAP